MSQHKKTSYAAVLGQVLVEKRNLLGLEQGEVSHKLGLSQSSWSRIEAGQAVLGTEQLHKAAQVLGAEPHELLAEVDSRVRMLLDDGVQIVSAKELNEIRKEAKTKGAAIGPVLVGAALTALVLTLLSKK